MAQYGQIHRIVDFVARSIPKRGEGQFVQLFAHSVIEFVEELSAIQDGNSNLTLNFQTGDGIWVIYNGRLLCIFLPGQKHIRLIVGKHWQNLASSRLLKFTKTNSAGSLFKNRLHNEPHFQWRLGVEELQYLPRFFQRLKRDNTKKRLLARDHPRHFSGEDRQAALTAFLRGGSWCPGIVGRKKHKLDLGKGDRIEFDHILPYAGGGTSGVMNIQVLCEECNRAKRATSL